MLASVCCWGTNSVLPSSRSTGVIDLLYAGTVPPRDSCGSSAERAARAWCPRCCASAIASDRVTALEESGGAVWTASVGVTNAPRARARMMHTRLFMRSLVAEADDWILSRGAVGGHDPEREAHGKRHAEGDEHRQG